MQPVLCIFVSVLVQVDHPVVDHVPEVSLILDLSESDKFVEGLGVDTLFEEKPLLIQAYIEIR
jgi:hypothetical protein